MLFFIDPVSTSEHDSLIRGRKLNKLSPMMSDRMADVRMGLIPRDKNGYPSFVARPRTSSIVTRPMVTM
jgi:hypothetical protein